MDLCITYSFTYHVEEKKGKNVNELQDIIEEIKYTHNDGKTLTNYDAKRICVIEEHLKILEIVEPFILDEISYINEYNERKYLSWYEYVTWCYENNKKPMWTNEQHEQLIKYFKNKA